VEGGGTINAAFLETGLVDRIYGSLLPKLLVVKMLHLQLGKRI
jgi:riboflavin biosynthesis pyrimidine reductase